MHPELFRFSLSSVSSAILRLAYRRRLSSAVVATLTSIETLMPPGRQSAGFDAPPPSQGRELLVPATDGARVHFRPADHWVFHLKSPVFSSFTLMSAIFDSLQFSIRLNGCPPAVMLDSSVRSTQRGSNHLEMAVIP
jgi:hypothetical protein